jgi:hypothetical protein
MNISEELIKATSPTEEAWRDVASFPGLYEVSSCGRVRRHINSTYRQSTKPGKILLLDTSTDYARVSLHGNGKRKKMLVHRLVAEAFLDGFIPGRIINHVDGNKQNNAPSNLEWVTPRENTAHAWRTGLAKPMSRSEHGATVIDDRGVRAICFLHHVHGVSQTVLSEAYGVTVAAVSTICRKTSIQSCQT